MNRPEHLFLYEMVKASEQICWLVETHSADDLRQDRVLSDALLWNFTVLGEAAGKLSAQFREAHPEVPWHRPIGLRNRIVHGYWSVNLDILVTTAQNDIPDLIPTLRALLAGS